MKAIVIYSGGLDSTVLVAKMLNEGYEVKALSINYGQRHGLELEHAATICQRLGVEHRIANLTALAPFLAGSSQTSKDIPVPHGHYAAENMKLTVVPNRNALMLSVATAWAISSKAEFVAYGAHAGDHAIYPDCREEFCRPMAEAMRNADWHKVELVRPFINMTKADIVLLGSKIKSPMELSYSCYEGEETHCGLCGTCIERRLAFLEAKVEDPTKYKAELPKEYLTSK